MIAVLGDTVRRIRKAKGLTLQEVSRLTGLSVGFLSQVEHSQSTPSLASLRKIAEALDCSVFTLLAAEDGGVCLVRKAERRSVKWPNRRVAFEVLSPHHPKNRMGLALVRLRPGMVTSDRPLPHQQEGEEFAHVLDGRVSLELGDTTFVLEEGDSIYFNCSIPHRYCNHSEEGAALLTAVSPPPF
ncbi:MAG: XRE family transcriptional regulator [Acetobacteraceae bacterium]|nr:XRE family transcriptional regulator [Acetobacteraceae bacterium]